MELTLRDKSKRQQTFIFEISFISSYQYGPDTYLLQVRDAGFPARLREYLNVAKQHSADFQDVKVSLTFVL